MLLSPALTWIGFFLLLITFIVIVTVVLKRRKVQNFGPWALIALGLLAGVPILFSYWLTTAYVISGKDSFTSYCVIGQPAFRFADGKNLPLVFSSKTGVVNNTNIPLVFEELHYGKLRIFSGDTTIPEPVAIMPYSIAAVTDDIDYILTTEAPGTIKVPNAEKTTAKYWLHIKDLPVKAETVATDKTAEAAPINLPYGSLFDQGKDGSMVAVEGYLHVPAYSFNTKGSMGLDLFERKNQQFAEPGVSVSLPEGDGINAMSSLPKSFKKEDIHIRDDSGNEIEDGERVRVTGTLSSTAGYTSIRCKKLERVANVAADYSQLGATTLTAANMTDVSLKGKLVQTEGILEAPSFVFGSDNTSLDLTVAGISKPVSVNIAFGNGNGKLAPLPDNFSPADVKIRDDKGRLLNLKRKLRVFGVWDGSSLKAESFSTL